MNDDDDQQPPRRLQCSSGSSTSPLTPGGVWVPEPSLPLYLGVCFNADLRSVLLWLNSARVTAEELNRADLQSVRMRICNPGETETESPATSNLNLNPRK